MIDIPAGAAVRWRGEIVALQAIVGLFLALRLYFDLNGDLLGDEAYYWMWGQHLGWSYFDHPPLHAWLLRAVATMFGWHLLGVRLLTWISLAGVLAIFWNWAGRLRPADRPLWFWRMAAFYLASPLFFGLTTIAYNDHLLVFMSLLAIHCFLLFAEKAERADADAVLWLYLAAGALGLAALTKYNGVFVGIGFAVTFLLRPRLRRFLATPHPWLAALLALGIQAPVVWWNLVEGGASFRYHFDDRWGEAIGGIHYGNAFKFVAMTLLLWSPLLVWPLIRLFLRPPERGFEDLAKTLTLSIFTVSTLSMLAMSLVLDAYFYWTIVGFAGLMPLLAVTINRWLRWLHLAYGLFWGVVIVCNYSVVPIAVLLNTIDRGTSINYDWQRIAEKVRTAQATAPVDMVASTRYSTTSQLGFVLGTADAVKLSPEHSQYDYWQRDMQLAGKSAIILADEPDGSATINFLHAHFTTLDEIDKFSIQRFGKTIYHWRIFRGEGYIP